MQHVDVVVVGILLGLVAGAIAAAIALRASGPRVAVRSLAFLGAVRIAAFLGPMLAVTMARALYGPSAFGWSAGERTAPWLALDWLPAAWLAGFALLAVEAALPWVASRRGIRLWAAWRPGLCGFVVPAGIALLDAGRYVPMV